MKNIWKRLFFGLLALNIVGVIAFSITLDIFDQPGIHILGTFAHVDIRRNCYVIERNGQEYSASGKSTLIVSGYIVDESFSGYMELEAYPIPIEDYALETIGSLSGTNSILITNQNVEIGKPDWSVKYTIEIIRSDPDLIVVYITGRDGAMVTAVCGDSEKEAIANYQAYCEKIR